MSASGCPFKMILLTKFFSFVCVFPAGAGQTHAAPRGKRQQTAKLTAMKVKVQKEERLKTFCVHNVLFFRFTDIASC